MMCGVVSFVVSDAQGSPRAAWRRPGELGVSVWLGSGG
jgi:hypothetical protein